MKYIEGILMYIWDLLLTHLDIQYKDQNQCQNVAMYINSIQKVYYFICGFFLLAHAQPDKIFPPSGECYSLTI